MIWEASGVEASEVACCAEIRILGKRRIAITTRTSLHFIGSSQLPLQFWMSPRLGRPFGTIDVPPDSCFAIQRHKRTTAIFHFCDASWELSDVTVPIQPLQLQGNGQALLSS